MVEDTQVSLPTWKGCSKSLCESVQVAASGGGGVRYKALGPIESRLRLSTCAMVDDYSVVANPVVEALEVVEYIQDNTYNNCLAYNRTI